MPTTPPPLVCKACGYANESQRVYCHNCGVKLDRDILIPPPQEQQAAAEKKHREVKKIMTPERRDFAKLLKKLCKMLALAAVVGLLIDVALPPAGTTLPEKDAAATEPLPLDSILENLVAAPAGKRIVLSEADINACLRSERFKKLPPWLTNAVPLVARVHFEDNLATFILLGNVAGQPVCATLSGNLKIDKAAGLVATCTGGSLGRVQIPAELAVYAGSVIPLLLDSMKGERELLGQLGSIEVGKNQVVLGSRGPAVSSAPGGAAGRPVNR